MGDKHDTIIALVSAADTVGDLSLTVQRIFSDKVTGTTFMTIHKAKGLEADRVYIIYPELMPHPKASDVEAEMNIRYVAITRAKKHLTFVATEAPVRVESGAPEIISEAV
jgi:DNA helicase-2/ATP-dependent DNA helicase PcrA